MTDREQDNGDMTQVLLLLCAGKAAPARDGDDAGRALKDAGKRQAQRIGVWLAQNDLVPDRIWAASSQRAQVSAEKAIKAAGFGVAQITSDPALSDAWLPGLGDLFAHVRGVRTGMIVWHRRNLARLLEPLELPALADGLRPGSLCVLSMQGGGAAGFSARLIQADALPKGFPFPGPQGEERRKRPAYYYRQSAVIPYRQGPNGPELLLISSSKGTHWVLPKGIHEPGLSAQDSAAEEALEEAGIRGEIADAPIGTWHVEKWGSTCDVTTYAMRVTQVLDEEDWPERHRTRRWVSPDQAAAWVENAQLAALCRRFGEQLLAETTG